MRIAAVLSSRCVFSLRSRTILGMTTHKTKRPRVAGKLPSDAPKKGRASAPPKSPEASRIETASRPPAAAKKQYLALLDVIETAEVTEARGFDEKWEAVELVRAKHYYLFDDETPKFALWLKKHIGDPYRSAMRNLRVSHVASPAEIAKYTATKIDLALSIRDAREKPKAPKSKAGPPSDVPRSIELAKERYDVVRDGKRVKATLDEAKQAELEAILSKLTGSADAARERAREKLSPRGARLAKLIDDAGFDNIELEERDFTYTFRGARADQLTALGRVLVALGDE